MPSIDLNSDVYERLAVLAKPLVDTPSSVIAMLLDYYEKSVAQPNGSVAATEALLFQPSSLPPLRHTRLISAKFAGHSPEKPQWNSFVRRALMYAKQHLGDVEAVRKAAQANVVAGFKDIEGYQFVESEDFSYQGVSADDAGRIITRLARSLNCEATFEWEWRNKENAHAPGMIGRVVIAKNQT